MTGPKRKVKVQTAVKTEVPAAVQAILDQLTTVEPVVEPVVDPFARPVTKDPFASTAFASTAYVSDAFAATAAAAANVFGPADSTAFAPRASSAFGALPSSAFSPRAKRVHKGRHKLIRRTYILPPPSGEPVPVKYWMPMCHFLNCFSDSDYYRTKLFRPGQGFDFGRGIDAMRYQCMEDQYEGDDPFGDHTAAEWDENQCGSNDHLLHAEEADSIEDALQWCGCDWDYQEEWDRLVPRLRWLREEALDRVEEMVYRLPGLKYFYAVAGIAHLMGYSADLEIIDAVNDEEVPKDQGLAAAYADFMARDWAGAFCAHLDCEQCGCADDPTDCDCDGCDVQLALEQLQAMSEFMPPHPQGVIVFDELRTPVEFDVVYGQKVMPRITGTYVIRSMEYYSALARPNADTLTGEVGWNVFHMVPYDPEVMKEVADVGDDDDDDDLPQAA